MLTTLTRAVKLSTRPKDRTEVRVRLFGWLAGATEARVRLIESKTPRALRADHRRAAATTETMAKAMLRTKVVFITDQGSTLATRRRALRPRGAAAAW